MTRFSYRRSLSILVLVGIAIRLVIVVMYPMSSDVELLRKPGDEGGYWIGARSLLYDHEYTNTSGKKAIQPPGYSVYLAANLAVFGEHRPAIQVSQNLLFVGSVVLFALIIRRWLGDRTSLWAAAILLLNPVWMIVPQEAASENTYIPLTIGALGLALAMTRQPRIGWAIAAGVLFGLSALTRALGVIYCGIAAAVLWMAWQSSEGALRALRPSALMIGAMLAVIAPWTVRNYMIYHQLVPITTNSKMQLYIGNNPKATGGFIWTLPGDGERLWKVYGANGKYEIQIANEMQREGIRYILSHPGHCLSLWPTKFLMFWAPPPLHGFTIKGYSGGVDGVFRAYRSVWWVLSLLLGLPGLWLIRKSPLGQFVIGVAVVSTFVHLLTYVRIEYRQPVDFLFAAPIAAMIVHLLERRRAVAPDTTQHPSPPALAP
jgi:4-amino-4-deoxy-L-arabinose transferase-like glycosyltransferase